MKQQKKLSEELSVFVDKEPAKAILIAILLFNIFFFVLSALIISKLAPSNLAISM